MPSETPCLRASSPAFAPASFSRRIPMICSSCGRRPEGPADRFSAGGCGRAPDRKPAALRRARLIQVCCLENRARRAAKLPENSPNRRILFFFRPCAHISSVLVIPKPGPRALSRGGAKRSTCQVRYASAASGPIAKAPHKGELTQKLRRKGALVERTTAGGLLASTELSSIPLRLTK